MVKQQRPTAQSIDAMRAWRAAVNEVIRRHETEFNKLHDIERENRGLESVQTAQEKRDQKTYDHAKGMVGKLTPEQLARLLDEVTS
jgi:hypothetical protein